MIQIQIVKMVEKTRFIPNSFIKAYGCKNCLNKEENSVHDAIPGGLCKDFPEYVFEVTDGAESLSETKERYHIHIQELQTLADYHKFHALIKRKEELLTDPDTSRKEIDRINMAITGYKMWFFRGNELVIKAHGRIGDRERKSKDVQATKVLNVQELNLILQDSAKVLLEEKNKDDRS